VVGPTCIARLAGRRELRGNADRGLCARAGPPDLPDAHGLAAAHRSGAAAGRPADGGTGVSGPAAGAHRRAGTLRERRHPPRPDHRGMSESTELLVIGAGPCGLAVGIAATQAEVPCVLLDRRT